MIINNEFYPKVRKHLEQILEINQSEGGISIDEIDYITMGRDVKLLFYSFQGQEFWEEKI